MLGLEQEIRTNYVEQGLVKSVFMPVINHGDPSIYSSVTAECVAQQDPALFWTIHRRLFEEQSQLWSATRDFYIDLATSVGADRDAFTQCYDDGSGLERVLALDALRRERGVFSQPIFDVNGNVTPGLGNLVATIDGVLAELGVSADE